MKLINMFKYYFTGLVIIIFVLQLVGCSKDVVRDTKIAKLSDDQISLSVIIIAKKGMEEEVKSALIGLLEPTRNEKGCINFTLHTDPEDNSRFMFYENWENKELWNLHLGSPHIKAFGEKIGNMLAEPLDLTNWKIYEK